MAENIGSEAAITTMAVRSAIAFMPHAREWRSVVVTGSGMPGGTSEIGRDNTGEIARGEWLVWRQLRDATGIRQPTFGDYVVQNPNPVSGYDPRIMDTSAQLRYTIAAAWFVARGRAMKVHGGSQIYDLARKVQEHPQFSGRGYSWGDNWLADCAEGLVEPGAQQTWRQVTSNHHLTFVVRQIATLVGP